MSDSPACAISDTLNWFEEDPEQRWTTGQMRSFTGRMCLVGGLRQQIFGDAQANPHHPEAPPGMEIYRAALVCVAAARDGLPLEQYSHYNILRLENVVTSLNDQGGSWNAIGNGGQYFRERLAPVLRKAKDLCSTTTTKEESA